MTIAPNAWVESIGDFVVRCGVEPTAEGQWQATLRFVRVSLESGEIVVSELQRIEGQFPDRRDALDAALTFARHAIEHGLVGL